MTNRFGKIPNITVPTADNATARPSDPSGCSSFDMFRDYAERGDVFTRAFRNLSLQGAA